MLRLWLEIFMEVTKRLLPVYAILFIVFIPFSIYSFIVRMRIEKFSAYMEKVNKEFTNS